MNEAGLFLNVVTTKKKGFFWHKEAHVCLVQCSLKADVCVCVCFFQETVTPRRAAPSSTAVMLPQRRASSMTARTWPCSRYKPAFCTNTRSGMIVRSRIHSLSQASDWIGVLTSINEGNYCVKGMWELQVNASKCHTAAGKSFKETICCLYTTVFTLRSQWDFWIKQEKENKIRKLALFV